MHFVLKDIYSYISIFYHSIHNFSALLTVIITNIFKKTEMDNINGNDNNVYNERTHRPLKVASML